MKLKINKQQTWILAVMSPILIGIAMIGVIESESIFKSIPCYIQNPVNERPCVISSFSDLEYSWMFIFIALVLILVIEFFLFKSKKN